MYFPQPQINSPWFFHRLVCIYVCMNMLKKIIIYVIKKTEMHASIIFGSNFAPIVGIRNYPLIYDTSPRLSGLSLFSYPDIYSYKPFKHSSQDISNTCRWSSEQIGPKGIQLFPLISPTNFWSLFVFCILCFLYLVLCFTNSQLAAVRMIPWAKANINYTGQALIISAGMIST